MNVRFANVTRSNQGVMVGALAGLVIIVLLTLQVANSAGDLDIEPKTVTITQVETPTSSAELIVDWVNYSFSQHMLQLGSGNVSAIVSQYAGNANVTWFGEVGPCFGGMYPLAGDNGNFSQLMNAFIVKYAHALVMGNVARTIMPLPNGSVVVDSTFGFTTQGSSYGINNGTVSAQDLFTYSATNGAWLISREAWDFTTFDVMYLGCVEG
jgi:hypothetical protein